jgi:hypothetical protein
VNTLISAAKVMLAMIGFAMVAMTPIADHR